MKLKTKERCPLHRRFDCCGRSPIVVERKRTKGTWTLIRSGLWRAEDGRERCSAAELRRRKNRLLQEGHVCAACEVGFSDYRDVELGHRVSKGFSGATRDDRFSNLILLHVNANRDQGSMDFDTYMKTKWKPEICQL